MLDKYTDEQLRENARKPRLRKIMEEALAASEESCTRLAKHIVEATEEFTRIGDESERLRKALEATAEERVL